MPREVFTAGQVLTAAELNVVSDQSVMVFAGTAARGSAIPSPTEGMVTYLSDADELQVYTTAWEAVGQSAILQVVSTTKTDTFTSASTSYVDVTGVSASITPSSTSSKVLVILNAVIAGADAQSGHAQIARGGTAIYVGDASGSRVQSSFSLYNTSTGIGGGGNSIGQAAIFLDSPNTTSSVSYTLQVRTSATAVYVGRSLNDLNNTLSSRNPTSITLMEVAG